MFNKFIYEPDDLVVDYLRYKGKVLHPEDITRKNHRGTLENIVVIQLTEKNMFKKNIVIRFIIDMNDYFLWKRILKLKQLKTKML